MREYQFLTQYIDLEADGVNTLLGEYSVMFEDTQSNIEDLDNTLETLNGTAQFNWNPYSTFLPASTAKMFICDEWETSYDNPGKSTLSAVFKEQPVL